MAEPSFVMARDKARRARRIEFILTTLEAFAILAFCWAFVIALAFGPDSAFAATVPAPGMSCTYTKQTDPGRNFARTYGVEVVSYFEASTDKDGSPWFWVKREGEPRYLSFLAVAADLSGCK